MDNVTYVLDSNVLLYDASALSRFEKGTVVIPLPVLEEIDSKKREVGEVGRNARTVSRRLHDFQLETGGNYESGISIEGGAKIRVQIFQKSPELKFPLSLDSVQARTLFVAHQLQQNGHKVVLVSKDFVMRVKAEAIGISVQDHKNATSSYDDLCSGIQKIDLPKMEIDTFYKDGHLSVENIDSSQAKYCLLKSENQDSNVLARYNPKKKRLEQLSRLPKDIWGITPMNHEQRCALDLLMRDDIKLTVLLGQAGTGKTLLALACGLRKVFDEGSYSKILISRPIVPLGKDIGYLPGTKEEKLYHWMQPIYDNLEFLCQSTDGGPQEESETLRWITESKKIEMEAVTYIRGRSLPKMYMIIDEAQNLTPHEIKTVISRAGKGTKVILTGDPSQIDNPYLDKHSNGLTYTIEQFHRNPIFGHVFLERTERSELAAMAADIM